MNRSFSAVLVLAGLLLASADAVAQFGSIFGDPPRPPGSVPRQRNPWDQPPPWEQQQPPQAQPQPQPSPPPPPTSSRAAPQGGTQQGGIQSQPLPPPPGSTAPPPPQQGALPRPPSSAPSGRPQQPPTDQAQQPGTQPPLSGLPPGQRQPRGTPQPANTAPQPGDEVVVAPPTQKINNPTAVFSGLDKITGRIIKFDAAVNETVQFGALQVTPRVCYTRPPTETPNTDAFIEVDEITLQGEVRRIFTGWIFASSPGLHAVEHPIYDVWLTDCKSDKPTIAGNQPQPSAPQR